MMLGHRSGYQIRCDMREHDMPVVCNIGSLNIDIVYRVSHIVPPGETLATGQSAHHSTISGGRVSE